MGMDEHVAPPEVVTFLATVPLFQMAEFIAFPERRLTPQEWQSEQEELLATDPASVTVRALTDLPSGEMLVFDLGQRNEGFPLGIAELGWFADLQSLGLGMSEYLSLAAELAPLERQMHHGVYPFREIVAAFDDRGLREHSYWAEWLAYLEESRESTEDRMRDIREPTP
ncbi:hypothetical protein [Pseudactinotalea sp.]|uniref:hypothetical protein n=1 Tax=Pseudactinotalea sp. TaxID=1926260 RepID=UPI003B3A9AAE